MPLYEYKCPACGNKVEQVRDSEMRDASSTCSCGAPLIRTMSTCNHKIHGYCYKNNYGGGGADYNDFVPE